MRVLVTYASPHGSTRGIAERIAERLGQHSMSTACVPIGDVVSIDGFDAVVVGSAIHDQAWIPEAAAFLSTRTGELRTRPVWLFSVGMPGAFPGPMRKAALREGPAVLAPFAAYVSPRGTRLFTGIVNEEDFPRIGRAAVKLAGGHFGDFRDWPAIEAWADEIADELSRVGAGQ